MQREDPKAISPTRFYPLRELCSRYSIDPVDILRLAARAEIDLCVPIPAGARLYHYPRELLEELQIDTDIERFVLFGSTTRHSLKRPVPAALGALAVSVHPELCLLIIAYGMARMRTFLSAYRIGMPRTKPEKKPADAERAVFAPHPSAQPYLLQLIDSHILLEEDLPKGAITSSSKTSLSRKSLYTVNSVFALLPCSDYFPKNSLHKRARPIELFVSLDSIQIAGGEFLRYVEEWHSTLYETEIESLVLGENQADGIVVKSGSRTFPNPIANFTVPEYAPEIIKDLHRFNVQHWSDFENQDNMTACRKHSAKGVDLLRIKFKNKNSALNPSDAAAAMAIIKPLWAWGKSIPVRAKHQRHKTLISPYFEKIILVIQDLHKEGKLGRRISPRKSESPEGIDIPISDDDIVKRLTSSRHTSLSLTFMAPVAARMIR